MEPLKNFLSFSETLTFQIEHFRGTTKIIGGTHVEKHCYCCRKMKTEFSWKYFDVLIQFISLIAIYDPRVSVKRMLKFIWRKKSSKTVTIWVTCEEEWISIFFSRFFSEKSFRKVQKIPMSTFPISFRFNFHLRTTEVWLTLNVIYTNMTSRYWQKWSGVHPITLKSFNITDKW